MKPKIILASLGAAAVIAFTFIARAQTLPTFKTFTSTNTTSTAVIIPQGPNNQIRAVSAIVSSDLSTSTLSLYSGTVAHYITVTNASSATNVVVESTNGIVANALIYIQGATSNVVVTVSTVPSATNFTTTGTIGIPGLLNAEVEVLQTTPVVFATGAITNKIFSSDGLFVANYGRAMYAVQTGTALCRIDALTVHYDGTSQ